MIQKEVLDRVQYIQPFSIPSFIFCSEEAPVKGSLLLKRAPIRDRSFTVEYKINTSLSIKLDMKSENKLLNLPKVGIGCVNEKY